MQITYDKDADALYIRLTQQEFARNKVVDDSTILDIDSEGNIIGIELLDASKRIPNNSLSQVEVKDLPMLE